MSDRDTKWCSTCERVTECYSSRNCVPCARRRTREWHAARRVWSTAATCAMCGAGYERRHHAQKFCSEACKSDRARTYHGVWRADNRTSTRAHSRKAYARMRAERPDELRAKGREAQSARRARLRGALVHRVDERMVWEFNPNGPGQCNYCAVSLVFTDRKSWHVDHVVPLARGGTHEIGNLVVACASCNMSKGARTLDEWKPRTDVFSGSPASTTHTTRFLTPSAEAKTANHACAPAPARGGGER